MAVEIRLSFNIPPQSSLRELQTYLERTASGLELRKDPEQRSINELPSEVDIAIQLTALVLSAPAAAQSILGLISRLRKKAPEDSAKAPNELAAPNGTQDQTPSVTLIVNNVKYQIGGLDAATIERLLHE